MTVSHSNERVKENLFVNCISNSACLPCQNPNLVHLIFKFIFKCLPINIIYATLQAWSEKSVNNFQVSFISDAHYMQCEIISHSIPLLNSRKAAYNIVDITASALHSLGATIYARTFL